jgi:hypothetical protein
MKKKCAFCDADAVKKGGEHVWDDWLNRALPKGRYKAAKRFTIDTPVIEYPTNNLTVKLPVVCERCNSGWMSALTLKTKGSFWRAMLECEPFSLDASNAALLAAFTFMKAVVTDYSLDDDPFFSRADRERLRTNLTVPPLTKIWVAAYQGAPRFSAKNHLSIVAPNSSSGGPFFGMQFCSFTYVVGQLAVQLLAPRWKHISDRGKPMLTISPNVYWQPAAIQFWPHDGSLLVWPPEKYMGDNVIEAFIYRFNMPINVRLPANLEL